MSKKVIIYTMKVCPYCVKAKALLQERGIAFEEIFLAEEDDNAWEVLYQKSPMRTVPQIFVNDQLLGGYTDLAALDQKDQLASLK